jgi:hypothetical protein
MHNGRGPADTVSQGVSSPSLQFATGLHQKVAGTDDGRGNFYCRLGARLLAVVRRHFSFLGRRVVDVSFGALLTSHLGSFNWRQATGGGLVV